MKYTLHRSDIIKLIQSSRPNNCQDCCDLQRLGYMKFTGNQWNENWDWNLSGFDDMNEDQLWDFYLEVKDIDEYSGKWKFIVDNSDQIKKYQKLLEVLNDGPHKDFVYLKLKELRQVNETKLLK